MRVFDSSLQGWAIPWMANMHDHFRYNPAMMEVVIPEAAKQFHYVTAMPNFGNNRIRFPDQALAYRRRVEEIARKVNPTFELNVPLYLEADTNPAIVRAGYEEDAWIAAKLYPRGGTTGSAEGVDFRDMHKLDPVFDEMARQGMVLLIHAEPQWDRLGNPIDVFDRADRAHEYIREILQVHPSLRVVVEHITTRKTVALCQELHAKGYAIGATVAPQYLEWTRNSLFEGGMNPVRYSIPVLQREEDRRALIDFIVESDIPFLGTDCAPHPVSAKSRPLGCPGGVFNNPAALNVYFKHFMASEKADWLDRFVEFACLRGPRFYGVDTSDRQNHLLITEEPWQMPEQFGQGDAAVIPMCAGQTMRFQMKMIEQ